MIKIYTKKGDGGKTSLGNGKKVWKDNLRVKAYGSLDEVNSWIGLIIGLFNCHCERIPSNAREKRSNLNQRQIASSPAKPDPRKDIVYHLLQIQSDLMTISTFLANPNTEMRHSAPLQKNIKFLESWIDQMEKSLPPLKNFIIPGGSLISSYLHITRNVCRRAEREIITLSRKEKIPPEILIYLNRLSDLLFVLARWVNKKEKQKEIIWKP